MDIAHILPISVAKEKDPIRQPVEMYLAHLVLKYPKVFKKFHSTYPGQVKILDNGNYENLEPCTLQELEDAAEIVGATEVVLPDDLWEYESTMFRTHQALANPKVRYWPYRKMAVAQGKTWSEVLACALELASLSGIHCVGIPKYAAYDTFRDNPYNIKGRLIIANRVALTGQKVHLLGCGIGAAEFLGSRIDLIRSTDTSLWMMYAREGIHYRTNRPEKYEADIERDELRGDQAERMIEQMNIFLHRACWNE